MLCQESRRCLGCLGVGRRVSLRGRWVLVVEDEVRSQLFGSCLLQDARAALASLSGDTLTEDFKKDLIRRKKHFQSPSQLPDETRISRLGRRRTVYDIVRQDASR
jgi:hypothetical protein